MTNPLPAYPVSRAEGVYLELADGTRLIDGMSSWWACVHGYNHPDLKQAMKDQIDSMSHVMFGGITHEPAIALGRKLIEITHQDLQKVFLCDSGSVAVEVAMKMALQYEEGAAGSRSKFMTLSKGYHGDTLHAMSVCDPVNGMHSKFANVLPKNIFLQEPPQLHENLSEEDYLSYLEQQFESYSDEVCAFIVEPLVQGAGGMRFYSSTILRHIHGLCSRHGILLILDEIATGFGRTGSLFAYEQAGICPDIICLGKALTGGQMTLGSTLCTEKVSQGICAEGGVMMHGPTFMGNPLACATALASIELLEKNDWKAQVERIEEGLEMNLATVVEIEAVINARFKGAIGVIEFNHDIDVGMIQKIFVAHGIWVRPFRNLVYIMPPFVISNEELNELCAAIITSIKEYLDDHTGRH